MSETCFYFLIEFGALSRFPNGEHLYLGYEPVFGYVVHDVLDVIRFKDGESFVPPWAIRDRMRRINRLHRMPFGYSLVPDVDQFVQVFATTFEECYKLHFASV